MSEQGIVLESIREHIPYYLTENEKTGLAKALKDFPNNINYYISNKYDKDILQGDGWTKLQVFSFDTGARGRILGIILSNTCDMSLENKRDIPPNIVFAPIIPDRKSVV